MTSNKVRISVSKEDPGDRVGVTFRLQDSDDLIVVQAISETSLFANTDLKVGMVVESINTVNAEFLSLQTTMKMLREAEDVVTIVAHLPAEQEATIEVTASAIPRDPSLIVVAQDNVVPTDSSRNVGGVQPVVVECQEVNAIPVVSTDSFLNTVDSYVITATATKPTPNSLTGLGLKDHPTAGVLLGTINPTSIFHGSALREGLKVIQINDTDTQYLKKEAVAAVLRSCMGRITVRAVEVDLEALRVASTCGIVTATIIKPSQESKTGLGITGVKRPNNKIIPIITSISGLSLNTPLQQGMRILSINGVSCRARDDTVAMLKMAQNHLTIMAGPTDVVAATVSKATRQTKVGLNMVVKQGVVVVDALPQGGLFSKTDIQEGMQVLQINGVQVEGMPASEVGSIVTSAEGNVTVLARDDTSGIKMNVMSPPGAPTGGHWGTGRFFGPSNSLLFCLCCSLCGICGLCTIPCNMDTTVYYRSPGGNVYNEEGHYVGSESGTRFQYNPPGVAGKQQLPKHPVEIMLGPQYRQSLVSCGLVIFLVWFIWAVVSGGFSIVVY